MKKLLILTLMCSQLIAMKRDNGRPDEGRRSTLELPDLKRLCVTDNPTFVPRIEEIDSQMAPIIGATNNLARLKAMVASVKESMQASNSIRLPTSHSLNQSIVYTYDKNGQDVTEETSIIHKASNNHKIIVTRGTAFALTLAVLQENNEEKNWVNLSPPSASLLVRAESYTTEDHTDKIYNAFIFKATQKGEALLSFYNDNQRDVCNVKIQVID